ncbi:hypothetical protein [Arthrobacter pigmenti]
MSAGFRNVYGAGPWHALLMAGCLALAVYTVLTLGPAALLSSGWNSMLVWFLGATVLVDLILLPASALADRALRALLRKGSSGSRAAARSRRFPPAINYVRIPMLASGLLFLLFFPGIIEQGSGSYRAATGQTQDPFLERWLLLCAGFFLLSAAAYILSIVRGPRRGVPGERKR